MSRLIKIILVSVLMLNLGGLVFGEGNKMKIEVIEGYGKLHLKAEAPIRRFKLVREARLCEGKGYMTMNTYLERPRAEIKPSLDDYVSKSDYDKNPNIILNDKGRPNKDIFIKVIPVGTEFELVSAQFDAGSLSDCHYWIRLVDDPEYRDVLVDAVALTHMNDGYLRTSFWTSFISYRTNHEHIKVKKVPMFKRSWAKEIKN